jgi:hypothetical protein
MCSQVNLMTMVHYLLTYELCKPAVLGKRDAEGTVRPARGWKVACKSPDGALLHLTLQEMQQPPYQG